MSTNHDAALARELYLCLVLHETPSMRETVARLLAGVSVTELGRDRPIYVGDARIVANLLAGRLVHVAPTWQRRTTRVAALVLRHGHERSLTLVANVRAVLGDAERLGSGGRRTRGDVLAALL